jgi:aspartate racemase
MTLHIGILAHSAEGATLCYRTAWLEGIARMGPHDHPEITLTGVAMHEAMQAWEAGDHAAVRALFLADAVKLGSGVAIASAATLRIVRRRGPR